jgi:alpha-D-xyloside xylohydrolase
MKFTNGYWKIREGMSAHFPAEIFDAKREGNGLLLTVACKPIRHRGDTLGGPFLTVGLTSPVEGVVRVRIGHFQGGKPKSPLFQVTDLAPATDVSETEDHWTIVSGALTVRVAKKNWRIEFLSGDRVLTDTGFRNMGYMTATPQPENSYWFDRSTNGEAWIKEELHLGVGESIVGMGERFTPFVRNGQTVDLWNEDGGTSSELSYKNVPFYLSSAGYGVFVNDPGNVQFEVGSEKVSRCGFSAKGESLEYYLLAGPTPKEVLRRYAILTGKPALPPQWTFGLWLTTSFTTNYDEASVSSVIQGMAERELPLHVFHFDCFWMKGANWCDFRWDRDLFPDPSAMLGRLKSRFGLRICVWINSYIAQQSSLFADAAEKGYLVKKADGSVWQCDEWQPGMGIVDFTNPDACRWFQDRLSALCDAGVDCFKTDFGERIPTNVVWHDGSDPERMHNYYTFLYNKTVFEVLEKRYGKGAAALFARSATTGSQQFPIHWGGDCSSNYDSMAETLRGGLSLGLSGFGFWSHDISGFEHQATPDLYKRWVAFGLLSSHSRLHGNSSHRVPWLFDDEASDVLRHFTKLKCRLMPYIFAKAV